MERCETKEATLEASRSNLSVVLHVLDDIGLGDAGFSGAEWQTPSLDVLAARSVVLSRYYVQPVCSPTRAALLTSRYPFRIGLQQAIPAQCRAALPKNCLLYTSPSPRDS